MSKRARRELTAVALTDANRTDPTGAAARNERLCVRYTAPGWPSVRTLSVGGLCKRATLDPMMAGNRLATSEPGVRQLLKPAARAADCGRAARGKHVAHNVFLARLARVYRVRVARQRGE